MASSLKLLAAGGAMASVVAEGTQDTPVTRVVKLLKGMQTTLENEMQEDKALYDKLNCWCHGNTLEKDEAIDKSTAKIEQLSADIESLSAKSSELKTSIGEIEAKVAEDKKTLAEATALREKQLQEAHGAGLDSTQAIENLKAAINVLSKHHKAPPKSTVEGGAVFKSERDSWSFLSMDAKEGLKRLLPEGGDVDDDELQASPISPHGFLQDSSESRMTPEEQGAVERAIKSASAFVQARYYPAYQSQSGGIMGVLKQLKEEMEGDYAEAKQKETEQNAAFQELREAKTQEIDSGEKMAERKEDELATTDNNLAEAKEDLAQEQEALGESQKFMKNLKAQCDEADKNFEERKAARLAEIQAVGETISILQADEARDVMSSTYNFMQLKSSESTRSATARRAAAASLLDTSRKVRSPELAVLATSVELDAFSKVKKAIDDMVSMLKTQQADEVKKNDWCKAEFHENDMTTARTNDEKDALEVKISELDMSIKTLAQGIEDSKARISQLQVDLQRASEDRVEENHEFQKTVADQTATIEVLKKALDKLATFYDFAQVSRQAESVVAGRRQTPPVPQMEYSKNKGAAGVMQMIEKLIGEAKDLVKDSKKSESAAQAAYEVLVADTNDSVKTLQEEVVSKTKAKGVATKDKRQATDDLHATVDELEGLSKYNAQLHGECDYTLKNFEVRQKARQEEIESLQQAKQILSGASAE
eukprot:TRINITY_DN2496_c0_g1_i3.p1 TRINITY_DN2496_c0_g1~~TRINITY_DN2496_c0_g1_i3.p1  ORF type:complete len:709 (-),score=280.86 TRINITY_DN2496_c0_g1_i3:72-2198(-)